MVAGLIVKVDNFGFSLTFTIQNADGTPFDLTNLFPTFYVYTQEQDPTLLFYGACNVVGLPSAGICSYPVVAGNFSTTGTWSAEIEMTDTVPPLTPIATEITTETFTINVIIRHPAIP
jgi:hypothetical protein